MVKWLICLLWGHRIGSKVYTGKTFSAVNVFTGVKRTGYIYVYERKPFCLRCGTPTKGTIRGTDECPTPWDSNCQHCGGPRYRGEKSA